MSRKIFEINYDNIPIMSVGFVKSENIIGRIIRYFTHSDHVNHAFIITVDRGQKFATEETAFGLSEESLEQYTTEKNYIYAMYYFKGPVNWIEQALDYLAEIRRKKKENSYYDFIGLLSFVPFAKLFIKPHPNKQWCSENVASILKKFGANFITKTEISPKELLDLMENSKECFQVVDFYSSFNRFKRK